MTRSAILVALLAAVRAFAVSAEPVHATPIVAGDDGVVADQVTLLVADQAALQDAYHRFHGERAALTHLDFSREQLLTQVDFTREVVLVVNAGASYGTAAPSCAGTIETDGAVMVLIDVPTYQTSGSPPPASHDIYLFLRLPRRTDKPYAICFDRRSLLAEAPTWSERTRFALAADGSVRETPSAR